MPTSSFLQVIKILLILAGCLAEIELAILVFPPFFVSLSLSLCLSLSLSLRIFLFLAPGPSFSSLRNNVSTMSGVDVEAKLRLLQRFMSTTHERYHRAARARAPEPWKIPHVEGKHVTELKLHLSIVQSYEHHLLSAAREQNSMRQIIDSLPPRTAYVHADFCENLGVPIAHNETSDMWHGASRKTLSIFGCYLMQWKDGAIETTNIVYVADILEKSALFANLLIKQVVADHVLGKGSLEEMIFCFDSGNHFRSYESAYTTMVEIPSLYQQPSTTRFLVEKHGKGPCDACIFSPIHRFLEEYCMRPDAFADSPEKIVEILNEAAARDMQNNPHGPKWHIQIPDLPRTRPDAHVVQMHNAQINFSYCWQSILNKYTTHGIEIRNWFFSDSTSFVKVDFSVEPKIADYREWKAGYFQDPSWRRPALSLGSDNSITRKHAAQRGYSSAAALRSAPVKTFESLCERDESQLKRFLEKQRRKRAAGARQDASDVSL